MNRCHAFIHFYQDFYPFPWQCILNECCFTLPSLSPSPLIPLEAQYLVQMTLQTDNHIDTTGWKWPLNKETDKTS